MVFFIKFIISTFMLFFLPGFLLNTIIFRKMRFYILETIPYAFGSSIVILMTIGILSFILHLSMGMSLIVFVCLLIILALIVLIFKIKGILAISDHFVFAEDKDNKYLISAALISLFIVFLMGYEVEMPALGQEDKVTLISAQKISGMDKMDMHNMLFKKGDISVYLLPIYSFFLALLSYLSGFEVIQVYSRMRFIYSLMAFTSTFALSRALFPRIRELPWISIILSIAALLSGWGGQFAGVAFGQFFPFSQYQDFAICVLVPICFLFFVRGMYDNWFFILLAFLLSSSLFFIHIREVIVLLILYIAALSGMLICQWDKRHLLKGTLLICGIVFSGLIIKNMQMLFISPHIVQWNSDIKVMVGELLAKLLNVSSFVEWFYPPIESSAQLLASINLVYENPYYLLTLFSLPILFYLRRDRGISIIAFLTLGIAFASMIPIASLLLIKYTYSQILFGGSAYFGMFPFVYIVLALMLWKIILMLSSSIRSIKSLFPFIIILPFLVLLLLLIPQWIYKVSPAVFYVWIFLGSGIILIRGGNLQSKIKLPAIFEQSLLERKDYIFMLCVAIVFIAISSKVFNSLYSKNKPQFEKKETSVSIAPQPFEDLYKRMKTDISVVEWQKWYNSLYKDLPWHVVEFIRKNVPISSVFAAPVKSLYDISLMTNNFVYTSGTYNSMVEADFFERLYSIRFGGSLRALMKDNKFRQDYLTNKAPELLKEHKVIQYYMALTYYTDDLMGEYSPIFNKDDSPDITLNLIKLHNIEYIYVTPEWHSHLDKVFSSLRGHFEKVYDKDSYSIYRVRL